MYGTTSWISDKIATMIPTKAEVLPISNLFYHTDTKPKCLFGRRARWDSTVSFAAACASVVPFPSHLESGSDVPFSETRYDSGQPFR